MEMVVIDMWNDFLMAFECSRIYRLIGADTDAQDWALFFELTDHMELCRKGARACKKFIKTKDEAKLIRKFRALELEQNALIIEKFQQNV